MCLQKHTSKKLVYRTIRIHGPEKYVKYAFFYFNDLVRKDTLLVESFSFH